MTVDEIKNMIEMDVRVDLYGDFYGHERTAETLAAMFASRDAEIARLRDKLRSLCGV